MFGQSGPSFVVCGLWLWQERWGRRVESWREGTIGAAVRRRG